LCPRERRVFQSKLGVSSSNQGNLHHSPHTGHLEEEEEEEEEGKKKKKKEKGTIFFGHPVCIKNKSGLNGVNGLTNAQHFNNWYDGYLTGTVAQKMFWTWKPSQQIQHILHVH
jgi:hypothetical protein